MFDLSIHAMSLNPGHTSRDSGVENPFKTEFNALVSAAAAPALLVLASFWASCRCCRRRAANLSHTPVIYGATEYEAEPKPTSHSYSATDSSTQPTVSQLHYF